jgi:NADH:ubiquinone oxidoreductase subunit 6 (subunit J)
MPMDSIYTIGFYVSAAVSVAGGLSVAFLSDRSRRGLALAVVAIGVAGIYLSLSAGLAAIVALVCYGGCALLLAGSKYRVIDQTIAGRWRQVGAVGAAALLAVLAYAAYSGHFVLRTQLVDINGAAVGRRLFAHDALAMEAVTALVLVALVGAGVGWRARDRGK